MKLGIDLSLSGRSASSVTYETEATDYFAAMSVAPDATRKGHLNTLIASLKSAGVWSKLDVLMIIAAHDAQAARINAKTPSLVATAVNSPTFTTDRGYVGDGATSYLNTQFNPTTATTPQYALNSAHMGIWCGTTGGTSGAICGAVRGYINPRNATANINANVNAVATEAYTPTVATSVGHTMWVRSGASATACYKNGAANGTSTTASTAIPNAKFFLCAYNNSTTDGTTPAAYLVHRVQAFHCGSALNSTEATALYNALATHMTAVGA